MQFFLWLDDRLALQEILEDVGSKFVPPHVNIFYCFGGLVLTSFLVQVATGFALTFYYRPSVSEALASVRSIMIDVHSGWLIRSGHRWGASLMVCCIVLHVCRVYLTGGFKKPREVTWITGVALAVCTVSFGVTGYSLPYDQVGYWALRIVSGVLTDGPFHFYTGIDGWNGVGFFLTGQFDAILQPTPFCVATCDASSHARALFADSQTRNLGAALEQRFWAGRRLERRFEFGATQIHFLVDRASARLPCIFEADFGPKSLARTKINKNTKTKIKINKQKTDKDKNNKKQTKTKKITKKQQKHKKHIPM